MTTISDMIGKTFTSVAVNEAEDVLTFTQDNGDKFVFLHYQDCCETVEIESIVGDLNDLVRTPLLLAEESSSDETPANYTHEYEPESQTWTFYKFATIKGYVDIRWFGESNGYYAEDVSIEFIKSV